MADYTSKYKGEQIDEAVGKALVGGAGAVTSVNGQTGAVQLDIPDVPDWAMQTKKPTYTASEVGAMPSTYKPPDQTAEQVGADPAGTAVAKVDGHNEDESAHGDIRELITTLTQRLNAIADSDDVSLDQLSEIVTYIKNNKSIIDSIAIDKLSATDVINNLTSNVANKPLSAAQGVALKKLVDAISVPTKVSQLTNDSGYLTNQSVGDVLSAAKESGEFDGVGVANIYQKTTSLADGGENVYVVELTDGTVSNFKVRNGSKGNAGNGVKAAVLNADYTLTLTFDDGTSYTTTSIRGAGGAKGDKGDSYILTEADKEEIAGIVPIVKVAEQPIFVDSKDEMTDTSKMYVLKSDGMFYSYKETTIPGETTTTYPNQLVASTAELNKRYSISSASTTVKNGYFFTDYIATTNYASITPYNVRLNWELPFGTATDVKMIFFNSSKAKIGAGMLIAANTTVASGKTVIDLKTVTGTNSVVPTASEVAYVRLQLAIDASMAALVASDLENLEITFDAIYETESTESVTITEWSSTGIAYNQPADYEDRIIALETTTANNSADINVIKQQIANLENGETTTAVPEWWEDEVADTIAKIKALQVGRNCVTFPFFSDNHQRNGYAGVLIKRVMDECHIPYCFFGGDGISSGYFGDETDAAMREQDAAFDAATAAIPAWQFCRAIGNHEYYWKVSSSETHYYTSDQVYEVFMRENTLAQSKEFGGDTYYYVEDKASKVRWIVMDMNTLDDAEQITWLQNTALSFQESGWAVVLIGHQPVTEHYATVINGASAARTVLKNYINGSAANKADIVGWFAGHIHRDRIFAGVAANPGYNGSTDTATDAANGDPIAETLPWKTVSIISDNVALGYGGVKHAIDNSDQSHAIDFVTINKATKTVNLTRLGFGSDRSYTY